MIEMIIYDFCEKCMGRQAFYKKFEGVYICACGEERIMDEESGKFVSGRQVKSDLRMLAREGGLA